MGLRKAIKRAVRKVENFAHRVTGQGNIGSERSEAADSLLQKREVPVQRQAGGGQIKYTSEEYS